ncbi:hypothetical protein LXL04_010824 [Taraxacum kok-saghyz]
MGEQHPLLHTPVLVLLCDSRVYRGSESTERERGSLGENRQRQRRFTISRRLIGFFMGDSSSPSDGHRLLTGHLFRLWSVWSDRRRVDQRLLAKARHQTALFSYSCSCFSKCLQLTATLGSYVYINLEIPEAIPMAAEFVARDNQNPILKIQYQKSKDEAAKKQRNRAVEESNTEPNEKRGDYIADS